MTLAHTHLEKCLASIGINREPEEWQRRLCRTIPPVTVANKFFYGTFDGKVLDLYYIDRETILERWHEEIFKALGRVKLIGFNPKKRRGN